MAKSERQKQKLLYIWQCLLEKTDETHAVTTQELIAYLNGVGIAAERKTIYADIDTLIDFGLDIIKSPPPKSGYQLVSRDFELAEVKLLVDLVQSSKFITTKKSRELIAKLEKLVSRNDAKTLQRQVVVSDRNKASNETIYYSVDVIYEAIATDSRILFAYFEWDENKKKKLRREGEFYEVSPWLLTWDNQNYYLVAYDEKAQKMKHYRVDKMLHISKMEKPRLGRELFEKMDIAAFSKRTFGMFAGEEREVKLKLEKSLVGVIVDRFGTDVPLRSIDKTYAQTRVQVAVSPQFFGWLAGFGTKMKILSPPEIQRAYGEYVQEIADAYLQEE